MVSTSHANAAYYFDRDVECLRLFFERRYGFSATSVPSLADCTVAAGARRRGGGSSRQRERDSERQRQRERETER